MTNQSAEPAPHADVNQVLEALLADVKAVLGERFYGLYLYGSLASGDFNPRRSDIDFLVVTEGLLPDQTIAALREMHEGLWATGGKWAGKLEGAYLPRQLLRKYVPDGPKVPTVNEGKFYLSALGSDWVIQYHILRQYSKAVEGPSLRELIDPVNPEDLRQAVVNVLDEWWAPMLADHHWLMRNDYQAFAVQTMCRALYTLREGGIPSKAQALRWARLALEGKWSDLIDWADAWPADQTDRLAEVLELLRYTIESVG